MAYYYKFSISTLNSNPNLKEALQELAQETIQDIPKKNNAAQDERAFQKNLEENKPSNLLRVALDLTSESPSISLLCTEKVTDFGPINQHLLNNGIFTKQNPIEQEQLEETISDTKAQHHGHSHTSASHHQHQSHAHSDSCEHSHSHNHGHNHHHGHHENHWLKASVGLTWGAGLLIAFLLQIPLSLAATYTITALSTLFTIYLGKNIYSSAFQALRQKKLDVTTLYSISSLTIVVVSIVSLFIPGLPMMFETAPFILGFWHLGEGIEHSLIKKINKGLNILDWISPLVLLKENISRFISVKTVIPNDHIVIKKGEVIPVDGVLTQDTKLYTTRIDGSPYLQNFKANTPVKSGMVVGEESNSVEIRVTKTYQNSYLALLAKNIEKAKEKKAPAEILANKILKYFIPGLLLVALTSGIVISTLFSPVLAIQSVISILVSACPCALSLVTPLTIKMGMLKASELGILFNNGKALQASDIDTVVFDLNGTLTQGKVLIEKFSVDEQFLQHLVLLESKSPHQVAKGIGAYLKDKNFNSTGPLNANPTLRLSEFDLGNHSGISGIINGERFIVGNKHILADNQITSFPPPYDNPENGSIYFVRGSTIIGQIACSDPLRKESIEIVNELKNQGKKIYICTGGLEAPALNYAKILGIPTENVRANVAATKDESKKFSKQDFILQLKKTGAKVAMVGDGTNDAEAFIAADLGCIIEPTDHKIPDLKPNNEDKTQIDLTQDKTSSLPPKVASDTTKAEDFDTIKQYADIVIPKGQLLLLNKALEISKKTKKTIYQSLGISLVYNSSITLVAAGLFLGVGFSLNPFVGVILMVLESSIVLGNLYRFKLEKISSPVKNSNTMVNNNNSTYQMLNDLKSTFKPKADLELEQGKTPALDILSTTAYDEKSFNQNKNLLPEEEINLNHYAFK